MEFELNGNDDQYWMLHAIKYAVSAAEQDEVPVGAIVVHKNKIVGVGYNQREQLNDPTAHAEMIAITQAAANLQTWRLTECDMYVTLEPCPMCAGAILQARLTRLIYGASDSKAGAVHSLYRLLEDSRLNHQVLVTSGIYAAECGQMLSAFFQSKRDMGKK